MTSLLESTQDGFASGLDEIGLARNRNAALLADVLLFLDVRYRKQNHEGGAALGSARLVRVHRVVAIKVVLSQRGEIVHRCRTIPATLVVARQEDIVMQKSRDFLLQAPVEFEHGARVLGVVPLFALLLRRLAHRVEHLVPNARQIGVRHDDIGFEHFTGRETNARHFATGVRTALRRGQPIDFLRHDFRNRAVQANLGALLLSDRE